MRSRDISKNFRLTPMQLLPKRLNDHVIAVSLIIGAYAGYRWHQGGGNVWKLLVGLCGYLFLSGLYQVFKTRSSGKPDKI